MSIQGRIKKAYSETRRILRLTRKPKRSEYEETARITGVGMVVVGLIGFIIFIISELIREGHI
ncbi:MAG: protein translocase SEC61 complex subunit gamma [Candidatus Altiarchaeota archaeon]|nr:protein translocase SEC61 complex subunit gamma [Candidatus Altiarchaeota archaeon]